jgi:hypothetical protein
MGQGPFINVRVPQRVFYNEASGGEDLLNLKMHRPRPGRCARFVLALFGGLFLLAFLFVPCTTMTSSLRTDPYSKVVIRTTYPRNSYIFLPQYLSMRSHPEKGMTVQARSFQWLAFMIIVVVLGLFDYTVFCRLLRRTRRPDDSSSSFSVFR